MVCPPTVASLGRQSHPSAGRTTTPRLKWFSTKTGSIRSVGRRGLRQPSAASFADIFSIDGARAIWVMMVDPTRLSIGRSYIAEREDGNKLADVCVRAAKATVLVSHREPPCLRVPGGRTAALGHYLPLSGSGRNVRIPPIAGIATGRPPRSTSLGRPNPAAMRCGHGPGCRGGIGLNV